VFVIGDQARCIEDGQLVPGLAPAAIGQGKAAARNILADLRGVSRENYHYVDKGMMATIGRASAVAQSGKLHMSGFVAWLAWCFVHILFLIGFRNRVLVFIQWVWSYVRYRRGARLITHPDWRLSDEQRRALRPAVPRALPPAVSEPPPSPKALGSTR
jgi:NADH dehydrogenase